MDTCLTAWDFERHRRGEMNRDETERFDRHIIACERCRSTYRALLSDDQFLTGLKKAAQPLGLGAEEVGGQVGPGIEGVSPPSADGRSPDRSPFDSPQDRSPFGSPGLVESWPPASSSPREHFPQIEGYQIKRIIGRGGMGVVYEAVQEKLSRPVALKLLPSVVSTAHPESVARFKREAAAAARLHHTNIIPIYDFGESREGYYYAMELITGQPLSIVIKRLAATNVHLASSRSIFALLTDTGPVETTGTDGDKTQVLPSAPGSSSTGTQGRIYYRQVACWMADVAKALHYAHLQGMVHRDIKPGNLMLCTDGRIVILDFGLVKTTGEHSVTVTGSLVGTYRYMSPEQIGAKRIIIDARSDVYSLGATLYELLTFQPAFPTTAQSELLSQILFKEPTPPRKIFPAVPVDLQTICQKAMEKSPSARYQTAKAMADDLNAYLQDMAIVARRQGPIRRTLKLVRHRRLELSVAAAVMLLIGSLGAGWHFRQGQRDAVIMGLMKEGVDAHWEKHNWKVADSKFREVLKRDPDHYKALYDLATVNIDRYYEEPDETLLVEAQQLLEHAIRVRPDEVALYNSMGVLFKAWDQPAKAIAAYEKAREADPGYYPVWVNLAMLYATQGKLERAEACAHKGVDLPARDAKGVEISAPEAKDSMPWRILAAIQMYLGRPEAEESLKTALSLSEEDNKDHVATLILCSLYHLAKQERLHDREAMDLAITADKLIRSPTTAESAPRRPDQNVVRTKRTLALAAIRNEQWERAKRAAEEALAADKQPSSYAHFMLAIASARLGNLSAARGHFEAGESARPEALRQNTFVASEDGRSVWFDTAEDLRRLREQAQQLLQSPASPPLEQ